MPEAPEELRSEISTNQRPRAPACGARRACAGIAALCAAAMIARATAARSLAIASVRAPSRLRTVSKDAQRTDEGAGTAGSVFAITRDLVFGVL